MSGTPKKIALITAASIGMVLTQSSTLRAEKQEQQKEIAAAIDDLDDEVLYSALPDEVLEKAAGFGGVGLCGATQMTCAAGQACQSQRPVQKPPVKK